MKIADIKLTVLEDPNQPQGYFKLSQVPNLRRIQYTHGSKLRPNNKNLRQAFLKVTTDEGVEGICTTTMTPDQVEILRTQVLGRKPAPTGTPLPNAPQGHPLGLPAPRLVWRL